MIAVGTLNSSRSWAPTVTGGGIDGQLAIRLVTIAMHQMLFPVRMSLATSSRGGANTVISDCCDDDTLSRARLGHRTRTSNISNDIAVCHITVHHINVHHITVYHITVPHITVHHIIVHLITVQHIIAQHITALYTTSPCTIALYSTLLVLTGQGRALHWPSAHPRCRRGRDETIPCERACQRCEFHHHQH